MHVKQQHARGQKPNNRTHRKVVDHATTSFILGGRTLRKLSSAVYVVHMYSTQLRNPDFKLLIDSGQLPKTAATLALCLHSAFPSALPGMANLRALSAFIGPKPLTSSTCKSLFSNRNETEGDICCFFSHSLVELAWKGIQCACTHAEVCEAIHAPWKVYR